MILEIDSVWSPDLDPPSIGQPDDLGSFEILVQVALKEVESPGHEVFAFTVCTADKLALTDSGRFVSHVLVLENFSWDTIKERIDRLLLHTQSCSTWGDVIAVLSGYLAYSDG